MQKVLVVDDKSIFRDPIAASLRLAGYATLSAADGSEALTLARRERPDLLLLDVAMPKMDGLTLLRRMRADPSLAGMKVFLLTALGERDAIIEAKSLGAKEYLLKSQFSLTELLERIRRHLGPAPQTATVSAAAVASTEAVPAEGPPQLLTRDAFVRRAEGALQAKTLSGVVAQVMQMATSPRADLSDLSTLVARDSMLSARVLQVANSAAYASGRGMIASIPDAVRRIGSTAIRNIAASLGVFDVMPRADDDGGLNVVRCWQHSLAVAQLTERLAGSLDQQSFGIAYLVGLCHDLGEILLRTAFAAEYQQVQEFHQLTGKPVHELEMEMLGMRHGELVLTVLRSLGLPESIRLPIERFHEPTVAASRDSLAMTRVLLLADFYANGTMLASHADALVAPFTKAQCRGSCGEDDPVPPDAEKFRAEVVSLAGVLAGSTGVNQAELMAPLFPRRNVKLWVARDPSLSPFDPVTAALSCVTQVDLHEGLPGAGEWTDHAGLVVVAQTSGVAGFTERAITNVLKGHGLDASRLLWITAKGESPAPVRAALLASPQRTVSLRSVDDFVKRITGSAASRAA